MNKKILLYIFGLGTILLLLMRSKDIWDTLVASGFVNLIDKNFETVHNVLAFFPVVLFFGALALFRSNSAFQAWSKFSNIAVPAVLIIVFILGLNLHHSSGGFMNLDGDIDMLFVLFLYLVFIIGSIVQIIRGSTSK